MATSCSHRRQPRDSAACKLWFLHSGASQAYVWAGRCTASVADRADALSRLSPRGPNELVGRQLRLLDGGGPGHVTTTASSRGTRAWRFREHASGNDGQVGGMSLYSRGRPSSSGSPADIEFPPRLVGEEVWRSEATEATLSHIMELNTAGWPMTQ
eukprot:6173112-Pyramimonas_sp.AAC.1